MESINLKDIAKVLDCTIVNDEKVTSISTDTREITQGSLFIAIKGENFDGHKFVEEAFKKGAVACVVEEKQNHNGEQLIVQNSITAYGEIAKLYRDKFKIKVVGLTGSIGKTSTKEMVYSVLNPQEKTLKTEQNYNNEIGTPKTLLGIDSSFKNAVIEMGMSGFSEIEYLTKMVQPDIGIITNIGVSHIEALGSKEGILKAKFEITEGIKENGILILCGDDNMLWNEKDNIKIKTLTYGVRNKKATAYAENIVYNENSTEFVICYENNKYNAEIPILGEHNVLNAVCAFLVGSVLGYDEKNCAKNLSTFKTSGMRQNIVEHSGCKVIEDCYNASPDSMKSSLNLLNLVEKKNKKIAVLGDMLELGEFSQQMHTEVGEFVASGDVDCLLTFGENSKFISDKAKELKVESYHFTDKEQLLEKLLQITKTGDVILFKASRGMKLEDVIQGFYKRY